MNLRGKALNSILVNMYHESNFVFCIIAQTPQKCDVQGTVDKQFSLVPLEMQMGTFP